MVNISIGTSRRDGALLTVDPLLGVLGRNTVAFHGESPDSEVVLTPELLYFVDSMGQNGGNIQW